jgi:hypothetical protein
MISRRNFIKAAGLSAAALGGGVLTGNLIGDKKPVQFIVHGFIPADEQIISQLVAAFKNKVKSNSAPAVFADSKLKTFIESLDQKLKSESFSNNGSIIYQLKKLDNQTDADILISDTQNTVYSLNDMSTGFSNIRANLKNRKACYIFTAEYKERDFLSSVFGSDKKEIVIENEKGLVDRISSEKNYKNILINGPLGKTVLNVENGIARVHTSTCRHGICRHTIAGSPGSIIACAPNKVLIKIV